LYGYHFANGEEVSDAVHKWLHTQLKTFSADGIRKLMDQSNKYVEKLGDWCQKMFLCTFCRI